MRTVDLIRAVRDRAPIPAAAMKAFVNGVTTGEVPPYQIGAWLMAVYMQGLPPEATTALTLAMRDSGTRLHLQDVPGPKVDKHSTGGVGDKISIALAPLVAACGGIVPMVSGRGLGHTGGTLDKLEAIPGFQVLMDEAQMKRQLRDLGVVMLGQTAQLVPADRILYALRDVTATVESVPLITASILAKKLAEDLDGLVLDVKVGAGAFMKDTAAARLLAQSLVAVGEAAGLKIRAVLTRMDAPLGTTIGNALEVIEAIAILQGQGPADTQALTEHLAVEMLVLGGLHPGPDSAAQAVRKAIADGRALEVLARLIAAQGGDATVVEDPSRLPRAPDVTIIGAPATGTVAGLDAYTLGHVAMVLGAGRARAEDGVDPAVGLRLLRPCGSAVTAGEPVIEVHHRGPLSPDVGPTLQRAVHVTQGPYRQAPLILESF